MSRLTPSPVAPTRWWAIGLGTPSGSAKKNHANRVARCDAVSEIGPERP